MSVYVDNVGIPAAVTDTATGRTFVSRWSHLTADTREELHAFAARIGLQRRWFQTCKRGNRWCPDPDRCVHYHYDVTAGKRSAAIRAGAHEIDTHRLSELIRTRRATRGGAA